MTLRMRPGPSSPPPAMPAGAMISGADLQPLKLRFVYVFLLLEKRSLFLPLDSNTRKFNLRDSAAPPYHPQHQSWHLSFVQLQVLLGQNCCGVVCWRPRALAALLCKGRKIMAAHQHKAWNCNF